MRKIKLIVLVACALCAMPAQAHKLEEANVAVRVAKSTMSVTPERAWNGIGSRQGKQSEVWTIDGEQLNELIFFADVHNGATLAPKMKHVTLPTWDEKMMLVELPELIERNYRVTRHITDFTQLSSNPQSFLGRNGVAFEYEYVNADGLHMRGIAVATIIEGALYMINLNAPRLYYYDRTKPAFDAIVTSAKLD